MQNKIIIGEKSFLSIGFGPGGVGYSSKMQKRRKGLGTYFVKAINKFVYRPIQRIKYVNSVANALKIGFRLWTILRHTETENLSGRQSKKAKSIAKNFLSPPVLAIMHKERKKSERSFCHFYIMLDLTMLTYYNSIGQ